MQASRLLLNRTRPRLLLQPFSLTSATLPSSRKRVAPCAIFLLYRKASVGCWGPRSRCAVLDAHGKNSDAVKLGCDALWNIVSARAGQAAAVDTGAAAAVVRALLQKQDVGVVEVARCACGVLCKLASLPAGKQAALDAGASVAVVAALYTHMDNAEVIEQACGVLRRIATLPAGRLAVIDAGAPAVLRAAMSLHPALHGRSEVARLLDFEDVSG